MPSGMRSYGLPLRAALAIPKGGIGLRERCLFSQRRLALGGDFYKRHSLQKMLITLRGDDCLLVPQAASPFALQGGLPVPLLAVMVPSANTTGQVIGRQTRHNEVIITS
jgi:hypothetical protein